MASSDFSEVTPGSRTGHVGSDVAAIMQLPAPNLPLYRHFLPRTSVALQQQVLDSVAVRRAILKVAEKEGKSVEDVATNARTILEGMSHSMGVPTLRFMAYALGKVLKNIYSHIYIRKEDLERVREAIRESPVLLLPTHRSYMDFLVLSYVFFLMKVPVPIIAAGEDFQQMSIVGTLLRGCGAFFMRRSFGADALYWALFSQYVQAIVTNGDAPVEFFVEGTRSRTGKTLHPKIGLLSVALQPYFDCRASDIKMFPIAISYTERLENQLYVAEMLGTPKPKESLSGLLAARSVLQHDYGTLHVHIGPAISVHESVGPLAAQRAHRVPDDKGLTHAERTAIHAIANKVIFHQQRELVVSLPAAVATVLLASPVDHLSLADLTRATAALLSEAHLRGANIDGVCDAEAVAKALGALAPVVSLDRSQFVTVARKTPADWLLLAHFRNELVHVFAAEALCLTALAACGSPTTLERVYHEFDFLHAILYHEFFLPAHDAAAVRHHAANALQSLRLTGIVKRDGAAPMTGFCPDPNQVLSLCSHPLAPLLLSLAHPLLQGVHAVAAVLLADPAPVRSDALVKRARQQAEAHWHRHPGPSDAMAATTLQNAIHALTRRGLLARGSHHNLVVSDRARLAEIAQHIERVLAAPLSPATASL